MSSSSVEPLHSCSRRRRSNPRAGPCTTTSSFCSTPPTRVLLLAFTRVAVPSSLGENLEADAPKMELQPQTTRQKITVVLRNRTYPFFLTLCVVARDHDAVARSVTPAVQFPIICFFTLAAGLNGGRAFYARTNQSGRGGYDVPGDRHSRALQLCVHRPGPPGPGECWN